MSLPTVEGDGFRYATGVGESTPHAYWRLSETAGTTTDGQAQFARGTYTAGTGGKAEGPFGPGSAGRTFDGTTSHLRLPDNQINGSVRLAVELWFKTTSTTGGVLFGTGNELPGAANPGGSMPVLYVGTDGKLYGHFWNGHTTGIVTPNPVNDGGCHHVVLSGVDQGQTLWLDGVAVGSQSGQIQNLDPYHFVGAGASHTLTWPARPTNPWGYFTGTVSQVAVYSRGLDPAHVQANYAARTSRANYLNAVRAVEPHAWWALEDETASAQAANDPSVATGSYHNVALAAPAAMRGATAAGFNGTSSYVRLPNRQARGRTHLSVEMWFQTSATTGGVLYSTGNDLPGASNPAGGAMPVLYVGTDGKLYGHFWNNKVDCIVTPNVVNDGQWHHVVLSGAGDQQALYLDGNLVGSQDGQIDNVDTYDLVGAGRSHTVAWPARPANPWGHFTGSIGEVAIYHRPLDSASVATHYSAKVAALAVRLTDPASRASIYTYDPTRNGRLVSTTTPSGGTTVLAYDTGGFVHRITEEVGHATTLIILSSPCCHNRDDNHLQLFGGVMARRSRDRDAERTGAGGSVRADRSQRAPQRLGPRHDYTAAKAREGRRRVLPAPAGGDHVAHGPEAIRHWLGLRRVDRPHAFGGAALEQRDPDVACVAWLGRTSRPMTSRTRRCGCRANYATAMPRCPSTR